VCIPLFGTTNVQVGVLFWLFRPVIAKRTVAFAARFCNACELRLSAQGTGFNLLHRDTLPHTLRPRVRQIQRNGGRPLCIHWPHLTTATHPPFATRCAAPLPAQPSSRPPAREEGGPAPADQKRGGSRIQPLPWIRDGPAREPAMAAAIMDLPWPLARGEEGAPDPTATMELEQALRGSGQPRPRPAGPERREGTRAGGGHYYRTWM
jgi:hypothetical protein